MAKNTEELSREELIEKVKSLEEDLRQEKIATRSIKQVFVSRVNHEIRTPLNSIIGFANLLSENKSQQDERKRELYIKYLNSSMESLLSRIENLLDYSMLTARQLELVEEKDVLLDQLFDELYTDFSHEKHLEEKYSIVLLLSRKRKAEKIVIDCDRRRLKQMMQILMMNALKGTRSGTIEFGYEIVDEKHIRFFVSDSADQYRTEYIQNLFRNPLELELARKEADINLSIVRELVKIMKGQVDIMAHPGRKGNTIFFILPLSYRMLSKNELAEKEMEARNDNRKYMKD